MAQQNAAANKSYNILMLAPTMFFADYGNPVRILEEAVALQQRGHRVTILAYPNGRDIANLDVRRCWGVPFNYRIEVGSSRHKVYLDVMLALKSLGYVLKNKPDIIHAHMHEGALLGWFLSKLTGAPLLFDFQGSLTGEMLDHHFLKKDSRFFKPLSWLEKRIDHLPKAILTSSRNAAKLLTADYQVPTGKIHPTPDCANPARFDPAALSNAEKIALKQSLGIPQDKQLLVFVGLLTEYQGVGLMLKALSILKSQRNDFHLLLMGFPSVAYYQETARQLNIADRVTFTGKMPYEHLVPHLAIGDIAIAPKLSATEGNGKILNYMSMALPTLAFDTPVSKEYLGSLGLFPKSRSAESLAERIAHALDMSPAEKAELGQALRQQVIAHYTWGKVGSQIETVYQAVLAGHPQPALMVKRATAN
ncbi:MAG TPA: glycosyltransferase family 1 protein [Anaerolineae bacterium]|nr:glycosyltransferase family 1 protein [Anaerolineae bacterium]